MVMYSYCKEKSTKTRIATVFCFLFFDPFGIARKSPLKQGLRLLLRFHMLPRVFIARKSPLKQGLRQEKGNFLSIIDDYCKEKSTKTRIATIQYAAHKIRHYHCKEKSTKTRIATHKNH